MVSDIPPVGITQNERFLSSDIVLLGVRYVWASEPDPTLFKTLYSSLPQNHLKENGQKLVFVDGSEHMFHMHSAYYISSLLERTVMRNHIFN
jgi:hypothetical protein